MTVSHKKQWDFLKNKFEANQLSHAYLFTGVENQGKKAFAKDLIKLINCQGGKPPCQECANCLMIEKQSFPDFSLISPEDNGEIQISKIRQLQNFLSYKSYYGFFKAVIVDGAEKMNQEAQSCFLKTLEEPKGKTLLILISSKPEMLLPTIYSRCQTIKFFGKAILNQQEIDKENKILQDLLKVVGCGLSEKFKYVKSLDFEREKLSDILQALLKYLRHLMLLKIGIGQAKEYDIFSGASKFFQNCSMSRIKQDIKLIEEINSKTIFTNASPKLALEVLLMNI